MRMPDTSHPEDYTCHLTVFNQTRSWCSSWRKDKNARLYLCASCRLAAGPIGVVKKKGGGGGGELLRQRVFSLVLGVGNAFFHFLWGRATYFMLVQRRAIDSLSSPPIQSHSYATDWPPLKPAWTLVIIQVIDKVRFIHLPAEFLTRYQWIRCHTEAWLQWISNTVSGICLYTVAVCWPSVHLLILSSHVYCCITLVLFMDMAGSWLTVVKALKRFSCSDYAVWIPSLANIPMFVVSLYMCGASAYREYPVDSCDWRGVV